jgi:hypothetical protein
MCIRWTVMNGGPPDSRLVRKPHDGQVAKLPLSEIRKTLALAGCDCIGNKAELVRRQADRLRESASANRDAEDGASSERPGTSSASSAAASSAAAGLITQILELADNYAALLSLSGKAVSAASSTAELRRAYLSLSLKVHPDKHGGAGDAKRAFQALVSAMERIAAPAEGCEADGASDDAGGATTSGRRRGVVRPRAPPKSAWVERSNSGCHKTPIACPRCGMDWPRPELGLEDAAYNWLMLGLKEYICGRCALSFGCMSAVHRCPHCRVVVDYEPADYHRALQCAACSKHYGFMQFKFARGREEEVRKELHADREARLRRAEAAQRRAARAASSGRSARVGGAGAEGGAPEEEQLERLFSLGLVDACPRCGVEPAALEEGGRGDASEAAKAHLRACTDAAAIAAHAARRHAADAKRRAAAARQLSQSDTMELQRWTFAGRQCGQLWLLSESVLRSLLVANGLRDDDADSDAETAGVSAPPGFVKPRLIARLAAHLRREAPLMLTDADGSGGGGGGGGGQGGKRLAPGVSRAAAAAASQCADSADISQVDHADLPSNMAGLDAEQLACVAASYGLWTPRDSRSSSSSSGKSSLLKLLENARWGGDPNTRFLLDDTPKERKRGRLVDRAASVTAVTVRGARGVGTAKRRRTDDGSSSSSSFSGSDSNSSS